AIASRAMFAQSLVFLSFAFPFAISPSPQPGTLVQSLDTSPMHPSAKAQHRWEKSMTTTPCSDACTQTVGSSK
ncbi:MAG: hypothetical protein DWI11_11305, partial [Planctomycetota bacterium]